MSKTYLEAVNDVLVRLREVQVSTVTQTSYSTLIGRFVNDAKRQVEVAFNWNALFTNVTVTTSAGVSSYSVTGSGSKFRVSDVLNVTSEIPMQNISFAEMNRYLSFGTPAQNIPTYFAFNGVDGSYDTKVNVYTLWYEAAIGTSPKTWVEVKEGDVERAACKTGRHRRREEDSQKARIAERG